MLTWGDPMVDGLLMGGYLGLMTLMWVGLWWGAPRWGAAWRLANPEVVPTSGPRVSICIPARNEAENIQACVAAALAQTWPSLEVIVVDDRSTDNTLSLAKAASASDSRLFVFEGAEPPADWAGKPWACARAAAESVGAVLVFVDADVVLHPNAVTALMAEMDARRLDLFSAFGRWRLVTFWEHVVIPPVGWLVRGSVNLDAVNSPGQEDAFANGQLIAVRREAYEEIDGHEAVRASILEDVALARAIKRRGRRLGLVDAPWLFDVRLYRSLSEIMAGYSKNLFEGMGRRLTTGLGAMLFIGVGTVFPLALLCLGLAARWGLGWGVPAYGWLAWTAAICGLQVAFRWRIDRRDHRAGTFAWSHVLGNLLLVAILLRSVLGLEAEWKGRRFVDGRPAP